MAPPPGPLVEVREPGRPARRLTVRHSVDVGRDCSGVLVSDPEVSRRHLRLTARDGRLSVLDLGSTNGTTVNGAPLAGETVLRAGDRVRLGGTEILALEPAARPTAGEPADEPPTATAPPPPAAQPRPVLEELAARTTDAAVIRYRPGTPGEAAAAGYASAVRRARRRLAGLGSEPWGVQPQICLVDPFPDPEDPAQVVASGTLVDAARGEIWMVVTAESPPEPPERPLALFFGTALPAGREVEVLVEGYGLHLAELAAADDHLRDLQLPPLARADGELRALMALSFVRYLIDHGGEADLLRLLATARPGGVEAAAQQVYGVGLSGLEEAWRRAIATPTPAPKVGQFLRLAARYLRPHLWRELEMSGYMVLQLGFTIAFPFAFQRLIDRAIPSGRFSEVLTVVGALAAVFAVSLLAGLRRAYVSAYVSASIVRQIRTEMFGRLQALSAGWFAARQQGDVLSRLLSDVTVLESGLSQTLREGAFQAASVLAAAVVLLVLNLPLAAVILLGAPLVAIVYRRMDLQALYRSRAVQEQVGGLLSIAAENFAAHPVVQAFGLEPHERRRFLRAADRLFARQLRLQLFGGVFSLSVNMIVTALRLVVLGLGGWLILRGRLTLGTYVAVITLINQVLGPVSTLTGIGQQIQGSTGALLRINEILAAEPDIGDDPEATALPPLSGEIRFASVSFAYTAERPTLTEVDAVIPAGSKVAFVGPTGAGKSSLLALLLRFYDPSEGAVLFDGHDLRRVTVASLRAQVGIVFQDTFLFNATIGENIPLGRPEASRADIEAAARAAELHGFVTGLPRGYDTPVGERGVRLSGGQRQRLALARALLRNPRVLLLDEATSALDPRTERLIATTLEAAGRGRTTVAVTHRLTSVVGYDRIFVMEDGRIVEAGRHEELLAAGGVYADLWAEQTGGAVPDAAAFDVLAALAGVPPFADLGRDELAAVARSLRELRLEPGDTLPEGRGRMCLLRAGRAEVLTPDLGGALVPTAELGPGQAFGVPALLGEESGAVLRALRPVWLLTLTDEALAGLAGTLPPVAAVLAGSSQRPAPAGGSRLSQLRLRPSGPATAPDLVPATPPPRVAPGTEPIRPG